jgi:transposase
MPYRYSSEFRTRACERMLSGESVANVASDLKISIGTLHRWKKQALIDHDLLPGVKSFESDELAQARKTIKDLESELELVKAAAAIFNGEVPISPKGGSRLLKN